MSLESDAGLVKVAVSVHIGVATAGLPLGSAPPMDAALASLSMISESSPASSSLAAACTETTSETLATSARAAAAASVTTSVYATRNVAPIRQLSEIAPTALLATDLPSETLLWNRGLRYEAEVRLWATAIRAAIGSYFLMDLAKIMAEYAGFEFHLTMPSHFVHPAAPKNAAAATSAVAGLVGTTYGCTMSIGVGDATGGGAVQPHVAASVSDMPTVSISLIEIDRAEFRPSCLAQFVTNEFVLGRTWRVPVHYRTTELLHWGAITGHVW
jgi:hypothetical protein